MRNLTSTFGLLAILAMPSGVLAQQGDLAWAFYPDTDPSTGLATGFAVLGVPQTDDQALTLWCQVAPGTPMQVEASFNMPVSAFQSEVPVTLQWQTVAASGVEPGLSFIGGISDGIRVPTALMSRLMAELSAAPQITYFDVNVSGQPPVTLPLPRDRAALDAFTSYCAEIERTGGTLAASPAPDPAVNLVPELGPNISGHVWSRFTQVSEDVFATVLEVSYGVPETDDVFIRGACVIGAQGPLVAMQIAADIEGLTDGAPATLRVRNGAGQVHDVEGSVIGTEAEFGISGIDVVLELSDPAWLVIAGDPTVQFERLGSRGGFTLTGNGPSTLGPFIADCDQIDRLSPDTTSPSPSTPIGAQDGFLSCDSFGRVGSRDMGQPTVLTFINDSGAYRGLIWIDPDGTPVDQGGMNPGEQMSFTTDPGHIWMATDGPGNCREMIQPIAGQTAYQMLAQ